MKAYTYLIGWKSLDKWYYGVRMARNCHPNELMETYFTSSSAVHSLIESFGKPDVIMIRKEFKSADVAYNWESRVLRKMKVSSLSKWINRHENYPLSPFGSPEFKKMMVKVHGVEYTSQIPEVANRVSMKLKGRMAVFDKENQSMIYIQKEEYHNNKDRYLHPSSYAYRNLNGNYEKQTKESKNYQGFTIVYDKLAQKSTKIQKEEFQANRDRYISINSKEYNALRKTPRIKNTASIGKEMVVDKVENKILQLPTSQRKEFPERYVHINSREGKKIISDLRST